ncbi:hypothetical protein SK128_005163 [Halocaridina rubra]|uniref:Late endosomal/lysosomal adaptor and MAPK and MTOR activator 5 n=1 Tax=Halocaridina rubra TaxID=373956 RepID=A0AAN8XS18_HALRR
MITSSKWILQFNNGHFPLGTLVVQLLLVPNERQSQSDDAKAPCTPSVTKGKPRYVVLRCYRIANMEKPLEKCLDEVHQSAGVSGVLCADSQGLCLGVRGRASSMSSGVISSLASKAAMLEPGSSQPVILLESDSSQCLIHRNNGITLAIYKSPEVS